MAASSFGLAILGIIAILIAGSASIDTSSGIWLTVKVLPGVGLILGTLLLVAFIVVLTVRRSRGARDAAN